MTLVRLDIGCGKNKRPADASGAWTGVDKLPFEGVDVLLDVVERRIAVDPQDGVMKDWGFKPWPWETSSIDEAHSSHFIEHLEPIERVWFFNELWRVLKPGATAQIIAPHWSSGRAYGDPTHKWPALSDMAFFYLKREWRMSQAPHTDVNHWPQGYSCDFEATWGYSFRNDPEFMCRADGYKQYAMANYRDTIMDIVATVKAVGK